MSGRRDAVIASMFAAVVLVAGCGSGDTPVTGESTADSPAPAGPQYGPVAGSPSTPVLRSDIATVQVIQSPAVGAIVADGQEFTLYRYEKDTASPSKSSCLEPECSLVFPPLVAAGGKIDVKAGVDGALISTMKRPDGVEQVTLAGWPLYRYVDDEQAGDAVGNGKDGLWFAIGPDGGKAKG